MAQQPHETSDTIDFGHIKNDAMVLSDFGNFADRCWREIPEHFSFVSLDEYIIMPNHVHGIVEIMGGTRNVAERQNVVEPQDIAETQDIASLRGGKLLGVETQNIASLRGGKFGAQSRNLGSIIRGFKIGVTKYAASKNISFAWQSRFYDHVIRDEEDLNRVRDYVLSNPANWDKDEENT